MENEERQGRYEDYIGRVDPVAAAIGRRAPYHLEYLRAHGPSGVPGDAGKRDEDGQGGLG